MVRRTVRRIVRCEGPGKEFIYFFLVPILFGGVMVPGMERLPCKGSISELVFSMIFIRACKGNLDPKLLWGELVVIQGLQ